jgi:hypothetical protein
LLKTAKSPNTFVYVKEGTVEGGKKIADYGWPVPPTPVKLDQNGLPLRTTRARHSGKSEAHYHQQRCYPAQHPPDTKAESGVEPDAGQRRASDREDLCASEVLIPVKCNQHPWMKAYIGVMRHPLFAVSSDTARFEIKGVPPGTYTVVAWKEGGANGEEKTMQVTVPRTAARRLTFRWCSDQLDEAVVADDAGARAAGDETLG